MLAYWRDGFDWRAQEAKLNAFRQFIVPLAGIDLHFIHEGGKGPNPTPLLLCHGWPGSVMEFYKLLPSLLLECKKILSPNPLFVQLTAYAVKASAVTLYQALDELMRDLKGSTTAGEIGLLEKSAGRFLSTAIFTRWARIPNS